MRMRRWWHEIHYYFIKSKSVKRNAVKDHCALFFPHAKFKKFKLKFPKVSLDLNLNEEQHWNALRNAKLKLEMPHCHRVVTASPFDVNPLRPFVTALLWVVTTVGDSFATHSRCWWPRQRLATFLNSLKKLPSVGNHWRWWQRTGDHYGDGGQCGGNPPQPSVATKLPA